MVQADATLETRTLGARFQHGRSEGVLGSRSPATTGFSIASHRALSSAPETSQMGLPIP